MSAKKEPTASNSISKRLENLSPEKRILLGKFLREEGTSRAPSTAQEPIAVIGMACRFPGGVNTPEAFWELLSEGKSAISEIPEERWRLSRLNKGKLEPHEEKILYWGGFLNAIDKFDPSFFDISPREAATMDPQQRIAMEVAWEALESAGQTCRDLNGSDTGVFMGLHSQSSDYYWLQLNEPGALEAHAATGGAHSIAANRLSYFLDLHGPSMTIDTACSSSLVATHLACQSLRNKECSTALAGGANLILSIENSYAFSKLQFMSPDGRCMTFDAGANGYVRGEGCGVIVLRRLKDAIASGDPIIAIIRGSAVNQDGASNGLTAPNGLSQQAVVHQALKNAGVAPHNITFVETHGTGTALGDPIEVESLIAVLGGKHHGEQECYLGAVKSNIGHLEAAAGIAGIIKAILCMQHGCIPANLHFKKLNPNISLRETRIRIPTEIQPWLAKDGERYAGVSSFGFGGTNAHVILQEATRRPASRPGLSNLEKVSQIFLLPLSARSEKALRQQAQAYCDHLSLHPELPLADICFTAGVGRTHFEHRLATVAQSVDQLQAKLSDFASGNVRDGLTTSRTRDRQDLKTAFLFTGQGSQYVGMGRELFDTRDRFRKTMKRCNDILEPYLQRPLLDIIYPDREKHSALDETRYTQPALFAIEYALADLWKSWGIEPTVVMGHSVGEYVAACVAGVFSLEDGLKLVAARAHQMQSLPGDGKMVAIFADENRVAGAIQAYSEEVTIAAFNSPTNTVISGQRPAVDEIVEHLQALGIKTIELTVSHAFHSQLMEPMLDEFRRVAAEVSFSSPQIELISNVTGRPITDEIATAEYWCTHLRRPVRFATGMQTLLEMGHEVFVEVGPKPMLLSMGQNCLGDGLSLEKQARLEWLPSLRPRIADREQMLQSLGRMYSLGETINWPAVFNADEPRKVPLPAYPWQSTRHWMETHPRTDRTPQPLPKLEGSYDTLHPLLGRRLNTPRHIFESRFSADSSAGLDTRRIFGVSVFPMTTYINLALAAAAEAFHADARILEELVFHEVMTLAEDEERVVQIILGEAKDGKASCEVFSREAGDTNHEESSWRLHMTGLMQLRHSNKIDTSMDASLGSLLGEIKARCGETISGSKYYEGLREWGFTLEPNAEVIKRIWWRPGEALAEFQIPRASGAESGVSSLLTITLDAAFQLFAAVLPESNIRTKTEMDIPASLHSFRIYDPFEPCTWGYVCTRPVKDPQANIRILDIRLYDDALRLIAEIEGLCLKPVMEQEALRRVQWDQMKQCLYQMRWLPKASEVSISESSSPDFFPVPAQIANAVVARFSQADFENSFERYGRLSPSIDALCTGYILEALERLNWNFHLHDRISFEVLVQHTGVKSQHHPLVRRMLEILEEEGMLRRIDNEWEVCRVLETGNAQEQWRMLLDEFPEFDAELTLLGRCGGQLGEVLSGETDSLQLIFPEGSLTSAENFYQGSSIFGLWNILIQSTLAAALSELPKGRKVRILEIGAGTGATTAAVAQILPENQTEYCFTDVSKLFLTAAKTKFRDDDYFSYNLLDIERDPESQGFAIHQYDLILAANVLHATADLERTLDNIKKLLAPNGLLILLEVTARVRWIDLIFGMTEGWWRFKDTQRRPSYPLLSRQGWVQLLEEQGFERPTTVPHEEIEFKDQFPHAIIMANGPEIDSQTAPPKPATFATGRPPNWLVFADRGGIGEIAADRMRAQGQACVLVHPDASYHAPVDHRACINPLRQADFERLLDDVNAAGQGTLTGVVHLWGLDTGDLDPSAATFDALQACGSVIHLTQALIKANTENFRFLLVTRGVQAVEGRQQPLSLGQAPLWGLGRAIDLERPDLWGALVDLDPEDSPDVAAEKLLEEIWRPDGEDQIAFCGQRRFVARLEKAPTPAEPAAAVTFRPDGAYLITGGLGRLGLKVASWIVSRGGRHIVLLGRRGLPATHAEKARTSDERALQKIEAIKSMERQGASVRVVAADVSEWESLATLMGEFGKTQPPLRGVIHAAAIIELIALTALNLDSLESALKSKLMGAWALHRLTQRMDLDFFVLFSSGAALWGSKDLAHYAAANHFLDSLAHYRRRQGLPATSINWGWWSGGGTTPEAEAYFKQIGLNPMSDEQCLLSLNEVLSSGAVQRAVSNFNWRIFGPILEAKKRRPMLEKLIDRFAAGVQEQPAERVNWIQKLSQIPTSQQRERILNHVRAIVSQVLGIDKPDAIDTKQGFFSMGMDSIMTLQLRTRLQDSLGRSLPPTLAFENPNIEALAEFLATDVLSIGPPAEKNDEFSSETGGSNVSDASDALSEADLVNMLSERLKNLGKIDDGSIGGL